MKVVAWIAAAAACVTAQGYVDAAGPDSVVNRPIYKEALTQHLSRDSAVQAGAVVLVGDSIIHNIPNAGARIAGAVNYGIIGDTTAGILARMPQYKSIRKARAVVLEGGVNDLPFGAGFDEQIVANYRSMLKEIPPTVKVIAIGIFPVDEATPKARPGWNARIRAINRSLWEACRALPNCSVEDFGGQLTDSDGNLRERYHAAGDGIHLNNIAYSEVVLPTLHRRVPPLAP